ncbi:hypothetical protein PRIPAC_87115 [Pristionchus pacificus]|uniref:Activin_recp domain-containing protein n=1 Tax=Pristionchus pacificus TaxID=54126 RepID=A0A2A6B7I4_PRIPA|nr:hypothetical protein PRIPAC_87115 [Pristionchus pacificus]|eukprot:PDM61842.1 hypothetical protein PRIPAC_51284 [Pristionchus pacificus]
MRAIERGRRTRAMRRKRRIAGRDTVVRKRSDTVSKILVAITAAAVASEKRAVGAAAGFDPSEFEPPGPAVVTAVMRFPLLIALALLPLSAALKCISFQLVPGFDSIEQKSERECKAGVTSCAKFMGNYDGGASGTSGGCDTGNRDCVGLQDDGCKPVNVTVDVDKRLFGRFCCCKTDLCNNDFLGIPTTTTTTTTTTSAPTTTVPAVTTAGSNPAAAPTALFSLATAAAVIATRI